MCENVSTVKQEIGGVSKAFEKLLDRITDRLLPEAPEKGISGGMKASAIGAGLIVWCSYGFQ